jgi:predicted ATPase
MHRAGPDGMRHEFVALLPTEVPHLLLIGAKRDNEMDSAPPLAQTLAAIEKQGIEVQNVMLAPLAFGELAQLVRDSLQIDHEHVRPLIELPHEKTQGNPFFAIQFGMKACSFSAFESSRGNGTWTASSQRNLRTI